MTTLADFIGVSMAVGLFVGIEEILKWRRRKRSSFNYDQKGKRK